MNCCVTSRSSGMDRDRTVFLTGLSYCAGKQSKVLGTHFAPVLFHLLQGMAHSQTETKQQSPVISVLLI